jgi:hypothetical protein
MDKLKKFQPYTFWVLLAIAVILPMVGWFMARSGFISEAEAREKDLSSLTGSLSFSAEDPNQDWAKSVEELNSVQEKQVRIAWQQMYDLQKERMVWPKVVGQDPSKFELKEQNYYRNAYAAEIQRVWMIPNPLRYTNEGTETGMVVFPFELVPRYDDLWELQSRAPKIKEMMDAQEDIWLLSSLLKSIANVNETATSPFDAPVRQISEIYLRGGGGSAGGAGGSGGTGTDLAMGGMAGMTMDSAAGYGSGGMIPGMGADDGMGGGMAGGVNVKFDPSDEFGAEVPAAAEPGASPSGGSGFSTDLAGDPMGGMNIPSMMSGMGASGGTGGARSGQAMSKMERYIEKNEKWKTRGFYLEMVIDHTRLPDVLTSLTNSDWPVRITRVHQADIREEELVDVTGGMMAGGGMPGSDMAAGGVPGMGRGYSPPGLGIGGMGSGSMTSGMSSMMRRPMGVPGMGTGLPGMSADGMDGTMTSGLEALKDPILVYVAISGVITLYNPPPEASPADQTQGLEQMMPDVAGQVQPVEQPATTGEAADAVPAERTAVVPETAPSAEADAANAVKPSEVPPATTVPAASAPPAAPTTAPAAPEGAPKPEGS